MAELGKSRAYGFLLPSLNGGRGSHLGCEMQAIDSSNKLRIFRKDLIKAEVEMIAEEAQACPELAV